MTAIVLLFAAGTLLLGAEIALPGGIAGILGGLALLGGSIATFAEFGPMAGSLATAGALVLMGVMLYLELVWLPRSRLGRGLVVEATVAGQSQPPPAPAAIVGQPAQAETALMPTGYVVVGGRRYEAFCRSGHAVRGAALTVVGVDNFRVIVSEIQTP